MTGAERDAMLRELAANRGLKLVKSRRRKPGEGDYGRYGLKDAKSGAPVFGCGKSGLTATPGEIEAHLRGATLADLKTSLRASGGKPSAAHGKEPGPSAARARPSRGRRSPGRRSSQARRGPPRSAAPVEAPPAEPAPPARSEPPPLRIRDADLADSEAIAALVTELGYPASADAVAERMPLLSHGGEPPLLAKLGNEVVGCLTWHVTPVLHRPHPVGRITLLIVAKTARGRGVGQALVEAAEARLAARGCGLIEVTSNVKRSQAHAFYRCLGYERTSHRFAKTLPSPRSR